ncbi:MAG TPA: AAA family ATPase [Oligoflexus sp.]|uniref:AAA family ATPase n=1 Tax=Oligoflexus sp. TaxID=1971216 RepID=UPI002D7F6AD1|nr:AAA family ATPase [Oligoflexus sp.]HET9238346.1 AAA family ATPase [Oligoflexus sp.]
MSDPNAASLPQAGRSQLPPLETLWDQAPLDPQLFFGMALPMAGDLAQLHAQGRIHGSLTPLEFVVDPRTSIPAIAWDRIPDAATEGLGAGPITQQNLPYLSPERMARWNQKTDGRSDLYSLGVIFFQMLTGSLPFTAKDELGWFHSHLARTPVFPADAASRIPPLLQRIVLKLLSKDRNERYQSASGLIHDLKYCREHPHEDGSGFALGLHDIPSRLEMSRRIHGREQERRRLTEAFERIMRQGHTELFLISGQAGVGKTALIHELQETVTGSGGFFITGKFDALHRGIPYDTHAQAFQALIQQLLGASETQIAYWKQRLMEALGQQAQVIVNVIPALEIIIGKQPDMPVMPPLETQNRFHSVFEKFVSVFATSAHPLVLVLDDLQWADAASLKLLEHLASCTSLHHVLLIGAYRTQDAHSQETLAALPAVIREKGGRLEELELKPLGADALANFLAETLMTQSEKVAPLAQLLQKKTDGNPFFFIQYVKELVADRLLTLDARTYEWSWNLDAIQARAYTDNVADFMLARLRKLPLPVQKVLEVAACIGREGRIKDLERLLEKAGSPMKALDPLQLDGILRLTQDSYYFLHDRVQQAAYALLSVPEKKHWHLNIARQMGEGLFAEDEGLFDRLGHYKAAADALQDPDERREVARMSLQAARKAKASAANREALDYSQFGLGLLAANSWSDAYALTLDLHIARAECSWRCGNSQAAETYFQEILHHFLLTDLDRMRIYCILIEVLITQGKMQEALLQCHRGLAVIDKDFPLEPTEADVRDVYAAFRRDLGQRPIASLMNLPPIQDPLEKAALDIMAAAIPAAIFTSLRAASYLYCKMVCCSLNHGNCDASASAYAYFAMILGSVFGEYREAWQLGKVAYDLAQRDDHPWKARIYVIFGNVVNPWTQPMRSNIPYVKAALPAAKEVGDLAGACYSCNHLVSTLLALGEPLNEVLATTEKSLQFVQTMNYSAIADILMSQQRLILTLQGKTLPFDEEALNARICSSQMALLKFWHHTWKLQAAYLLGQKQDALAEAEAARSWGWSSPGHVEEAEHHFYHALTLAQACSGRTELEAFPAFQELLAYRERLALWAGSSPSNFSQKHQLIHAEVLRLQRDDLAAMHAYEKAIGLARQNSFIQDEALSYELAALHYERTEFYSFAEQYRTAARRCYQEWGAMAKVHQLDNWHPQLIPSMPVQEVPGHLMEIDRLSLLQATQSISSEIVPTQLSETLMRLLVETSGAESGLLILARKGELHIEAEARTSASALTVTALNSIPARGYKAVPQGVLNFVQRSQQKLVLANARDTRSFAYDEYLRREKPRSLLCVPILRNRVLVGLIYLENRLMAGTFTAEKLMTLEILASQAAISLENARLYADLRREEQKLRATIESMADGLIVADTQAGISLINEAALQMVGLKTAEDSILRNRQGMAARLEYRDADDQLVPFERLPLTRALQGEIINQVEYHIRHIYNGRPLIIRLSASPLRDHAGTIQGAVVVFRDVTELTELDRLKDEFLRAMAHELKTPLLLVAGYFEMYKLLLQKGANAPQLQECLGRMDIGINRLKSLMSTLVDVAVFQLRKIKLRFERIDLNDLCKEAVDSMLIASPKHSLQLVGVKDEPLWIDGDRVRLNQVLTNFLQNAIKYSPEGGTIVVELQDERDAVLVSVRDQGIGIPVQRQGRLFQRFYRAHAETEYDYGGMGVGLFLSYEIVQAHHGHMWFSSEEGVGSVFSFRLPTHQAALKS